MTRRFITLVFLVLAAAPPALAQFPTEWDQTTGLEWCDRFVVERDRDLLMYGCYLDFARRERMHEETIAHLESRLAEAPDDHAARLTLGRLLADQTDDRALAVYATALEGFESKGNLAGQVYTRIMIAFFHQWYQQWEKVESELAEAAKIAAGASDPYLLGRVRLRQGWLAYLREDYAQAWILFKKAEQIVFPDGPDNIRVAVLDALGNVAQALGNYRDAMEHYLRQADLLGDSGLAGWEAIVRYRIAETAGKVRLPRRYGRNDQIAFIRRALQAAERAGDTTHEAGARVLLARHLEPVAAIEEYRIALRLARGDDNFEVERQAMQGSAMALMNLSPPETTGAFWAIEQAMDAARSHGNVEDEIAAAVLRAGMRWETGRTQQAIEDSLAALDLIERKRMLQRDDLVRARTFSRFAPAYRRFADRILASRKGRPSTDQIDLALRVMERMRSRVLLDALDAADVTAALVADNPEHERYESVREAISAVQKKLIRPNLSEPERAELLDELDRLEVEEADVRDRMALADPAFAALDRRSFPTLTEIQNALGGSQALLAFQIADEAADAPWFDEPGSWVLLVTRDHASAHRIAHGEQLQYQIQMFLGLLNRRDGSEQRGAVELYNQLLREPLSSLPEKVQSLVVIPDGPLFGLPFGALRTEANARPLTGDCRISMVPSATLWLRWRTAVRPPHPKDIVAFADPTPASSGGKQVWRSAGAFRTDIELRPLPRSRDEARSMIRYLGRNGRLFQGADATEDNLKKTRISDYRLLHFATHAVIDDAKPYRSAVVLTPGAGVEDGLLQPREISALDLKGGVVILSACSSAAGTILEGEGVMGLARSFFQAGAHAVLGSLWPLRDDEASELMRGVARQLARGKSVGAALAGTQREWQRQGRPTASWSGMVVLGDGEIVPFPGGVSYLPAWIGGIVLGLVAVLLVTALLVRRRPRPAS